MVSRFRSWLFIFVTLFATGSASAQETITVIDPNVDIDQWKQQAHNLQTQSVGKIANYPQTQLPVQHNGSNRLSITNDPICGPVVRFRVNKDDPDTAGGAGTIRTETRHQFALPKYTDFTQIVRMKMASMNNAQDQQVIYQWHIDRPGWGVNPFLAFYLRGSRLEIAHRYNKNRNVTKETTVSLPTYVDDNFALDSWHDFIVQAHINPTGQGHLRIWHNDRQIVNYSGHFGYNDITSASDAKLGVYHYGSDTFNKWDDASPDRDLFIAYMAVMRGNDLNAARLKLQNATSGCATPPASGSSTIKVYARGNTGREDMSLTVNGKFLKRWDNIRAGGSDDFTAYQHTVTRETVISSLKIHSVSGEAWPSALVVDRIEVDGKTYRTDAYNVKSSGSWSRSNACGEGFKKSQWLSCPHGWFDYFALAGEVLAPPPRSDIEVHARGNTGQETMHLVINGTIVRSWRNVEALEWNQFKPYAHVVRTPTTINSLRVYSGNGREWPDALIVDKIVIDGRSYQSEAQNVYSYGSWSRSSGCAAGYKTSEWLSCGNAWFDYQGTTGLRLAH